MVNRPFYLLKRGLDRASKFGKFVNESKSMTPVLSITILAVPAFGFLVQAAEIVVFPVVPESSSLAITSFNASISIKLYLVCGLNWQGFL